MNLTGLLRLKVVATQDDTLLGKIGRMIEAAERGANRYTRLADRAARIYAPGVHIIALIAFLGWMAATGDVWLSVMIASALLIITCPCALGLAAPAVQASAGAALFRNGVLLKDGEALEKLAEVDLVVFDKTGTLTKGRPKLSALVSEHGDEAEIRALAHGLALGSRHPLSRALTRALEEPAAHLEDLTERPGQGVEARDSKGRVVRLGSAPFCSVPDDGYLAESAGAAGPCVFLAIGGQPVARFDFEDELRVDASETVQGLKALGLDVVLLSGDRLPVVAHAADALGIDRFEAEAAPQTKLEKLEKWAAEGRKVLMVGDGINDAPALAAAYVSMSPAEAADISRAAADLVFSGERLSPVTTSVEVGRASRSRVLENFGLAALYNMIAIPLAAAGLATPFVAAIAMSSSSILVTLNALRVARVAPAPEAKQEAA